MKVEKNKHDHKLTNWLKVGIFAILMLAPILASMSQMLYATFNKNAYKSNQITGVEYSIEYEYKTNEVSSADDLVVGNIYKVHIETNNLLSLPSSTRFIEYTKIYNLSNILFGDGNQLVGLDADLVVATEDYRFGLYISDNKLVINTIRANGISNGTLFYYNLNDSFDYYVYVVYYGNINSIFLNNISASDYLGEGTIVEEPTQTLDNAFYYGVDKMTQSDLFNWTQNTALYTGIKAMTDNLQIQTNVIAILLTYWSILTIVYIIIDIVLKGFTFLTHMIVRSD